MAAAASSASLAYILWLPDGGEYAHKNPKTTAYMELRREQGRAKGKKLQIRMDWRSLDAISPNLVHAVVTAEDEMFYHHSGIDWAQVRVAMKTNWQKRRFAYGGSTITQQLARNLYLSPSKNPLRKIKEALIARRLEKKLGKRRILELYLNAAEWGGGIFGAEAAANVYFGKPASELTPEEAVALASIMPSPRKWSPTKPGRKLARRQDNILMRMRRSGYLTPEAEEELAQEEAQPQQELIPAATEQMPASSTTTIQPI